MKNILMRIWQVFQFVLRGKKDSSSKLGTGGAPTSSFELGELEELDSHTVGKKLSELDELLVQGNEPTQTPVGLLKRTQVAEFFKAFTNLFFSLKDWQGNHEYKKGNMIRIQDSVNLVCIEDHTSNTQNYNVDKDKWTLSDPTIKTGTIVTDVEKVFDIHTIQKSVEDDIHAQYTLKTPGNFAVNDVVFVRGTENYNSSFDPSATVVTTISEVTDALHGVLRYNVALPSNVPDESVGEIDNYKAFRRLATKGVIVDNSDPEQSIVTEIDLVAKDRVTPPAAGASYVYLLEKDGTDVFLTPMEFQPQDRRRYLSIAIILQRITNSGVLQTLILSMDPSPDLLTNGGASTPQQYMRNMGGAVYPGGSLSLGSTGLTLNLSELTYHYPSSDYETNPSEPDYRNVDAQEPIGTLFLAYGTGPTLDDFNVLLSDAEGGNQVDTTHYNPDRLSSLPQLIPDTGPQVQVLKVFTSGSSTIVYYGWRLFHTVEQAQANLSSERTMEKRLTNAFAYRGAVIVTKGITDWTSNPDLVDLITKDEKFDPLDRGDQPSGNLFITEDQIESERATRSTGWLNGLHVTEESSTQVKITAGTIQIVNNSVSPAIVTPIDIPETLHTFTVTQLAAHLVALSFDITGNLIIDLDDNAVFTASNDRTKVKVALVRMFNNTISSLSNTKTPVTAPVLTTKDFVEKFINNGIVLTAANESVNSKMNLSAGKVTGWGINAFNDSNSPLVKSFNDTPDVLFDLLTSAGIHSAIDTDDLDPQNYEDPGDNEEIIPVSTNNYTAKRAWFTPGTGKISIQYGTAQYSGNQIDDRDYETEFPTKPPYLSETAFVINTIIIKRGTTAFDDDVRNEILPGDHTGGGDEATASGGGGGSGMDTDMSNMAETISPSSNFKMNNKYMHNLQYLSIDNGNNLLLNGKIRLPGSADIRAYSNVYTTEGIGMIFYPTTLQFTKFGDSTVTSGQSLFLMKLRKGDNAADFPVFGYIGRSEDYWNLQNNNITLMKMASDLVTLGVDLDVNYKRLLTIGAIQFHQYPRTVTASPYDIDMRDGSEFLVILDLMPAGSTTVINLTNLQKEFHHTLFFRNFETSDRVITLPTTFKWQNGSNPNSQTIQNGNVLKVELFILGGAYSDVVASWSYHQDS